MEKTRKEDGGKAPPDDGNYFQTRALTALTMLSLWPPINDLHINVRSLPRPHLTGRPKLIFFALLSAIFYFYHLGPMFPGRRVSA